MPGPLVEGAVTHDHVGRPGRDRHGRLVDRSAGRASAVVDAAEEPQLTDAEVAGDLDLGVGVGREGDHAVDVVGLEPAVGEGGRDRLHRKAHLAPARVLGELGRADAGDSGLVLQTVVEAHHDRPGPAASRIGRTTRTVPVTWSPSPLAPRTAISTTPSPTSTDLAVTDPVM